jgi:hypothetical protein
MWIINCLLLIIGTAAGVCGIGFFIRNQKATGRMRYYILAYGVSSALWCILFGMIGFCDDLSLCHALRRIADIGVVSFLIAEAFLVTDICGVNGRIARACKAISIVLGVVDYLFFAQDKVNTFVRVGNCTTWIANPAGAVNRAVHSVYIAITFIMLFSFVLFRQAFLFTVKLLGNSLTWISMAYPMGWMMCSTLLVIRYKKSVLCRQEETAGV